VSPDGGGTTSPAAGTSDEPLNSVIVLTATANLGFAFLNWTGNVGDVTSASTTVVMDRDQTVTANFGVAPTTTTTTSTTVTSTTVHGASSTTTTVHGASSTTTTTSSVPATTSTTLPCVLSQLPEDSFAGVECAMAAVRGTLNEPPEPSCTCKRCSLEAMVDQLAGLVAQADRAPSAKTCKHLLRQARRVVKSLRKKVASLSRRRCLAPAGRATSLAAEVGDLAGRMKALSHSAFCATK
jgi:hypothetical protein